MRMDIPAPSTFRKAAEDLRPRPCLRRGDKCSCVLCTEDLHDGIASPELEKKFQKLLSTCDMIQISERDIRSYFLAAVLAMQEGRYADAGKYIQYWDLKCFDGVFVRKYPFVHYYIALIAYGIHAYAVAENHFRMYLQNGVYRKNEIAYLHLGNCCFHQQAWDKALEAYGKALDLRKNFPEVLINIGLVAKKLGDEKTAKEFARDERLFNGIFARGTLCENPLEYTLAIPQKLSIWDIPIFINARDRLGTLQKLLGWLVRAGYRCIYILDNDSTYPPLMAYYQQLERVPAIQVIRLGRNIGHTALWDSGVLEALGIDTPYVYTDPDVVPVEECPADILQYLLGILSKYPFLKKVGLGLETDDITFDTEAVREYENTFYTQRLMDGVYFAQVDTTFALYRNYWHYDVFCSARTTGKHMVRHLPWYFDYDNLPEDERYYMAHANRSASLVTKIKDGQTVG